MAATPRNVRTIGVRPEKLLLHRGNATETHEGGHDNRVSATVDSVVYLGATSEYELTTSWGGRLHALAQNINSADFLRPGDQVVATWHAEHGFALADVDDDVAPQEEDLASEALSDSRVP
jgi:spermidine/putrescine transport system ATP-binding protein